MLVDENREYERYDTDTGIVYALRDSDQFSPARLCNYCQGGMCFETFKALEPGSDIYIMMEDFMPDDVSADVYDGYLAEVRWCAQSSSSKAEQFRVGVKYYQTDID